MFARQCFSIVLATITTATVLAQRDAIPYDKQEVMIPMRDGKRLFTSIFTPKTPGKHPIMMRRTPYSCAPYGTQSPSGYTRPKDQFSEAGYIFVNQDVRGKYMSEGDFYDVRPQLIHKTNDQDTDESTDTYDSIEWLIKNVKDNNGRVGITGISYPGGYAAQAALSNHPALKVVSPQAPTSDWFLGDDMHHNGAFMLQDCASFYSFFGNPRPKPTTNPGGLFSMPEEANSDAYKFYLDLGPIGNLNEKYFKYRSQFWNDAMRHGNYDEFWQARSMPNQMRDVKPAMLWVGGFFDAEDCWGAINCFRATDRQSPRTTNHLVMGPWSHGQWASGIGSALHEQDWGSNTSRYYLDKIFFPFMDAYLRGDGRFKMPKAQVFVSGANKWLGLNEWPPKRAPSETLYLNDTALTDTAPKDAGSREYVADPSAPTPYEGGILKRRSRSYMLADQRFAASRNDVLTYRTEALTADKTLGGDVEADIFLQTTGTDADLVVKIIDEFPGTYTKQSNYQMLVRGEIFRCKFRNSFVNPSPLTPGATERVKFKLPDTAHCFRKGHRIMVQIQSYWFPLADRNPNQYLDIYNAKPDDFIKATIKILSGSSTPSNIRLNVLPTP